MIMEFIEEWKLMRKKSLFISLQELLFACAKNITVELLQSLDQQKLSFQVSSLQIDNQLRSSPYPVMLSFDREYRSNPAERKLQRSSDSSFEPAIYIAVSKWRKKDISLVSFEYIQFRCVLLHLLETDSAYFWFLPCFLPCLQSCRFPPWAWARSDIKLIWFPKKRNIKVSE